jgi:hypothetical protein
MSIGREDADCELTEIIEILPGASNETHVITASAAVCNMPDRRNSGPRDLAGPLLLHGTSGSSRFLNSSRSSHRLNTACTVVVAIDRYQICSIRNPGMADSHSSGSA